MLVKLTLRRPYKDRERGHVFENPIFECALNPRKWQ